MFPPFLHFGIALFWVVFVSESFYPTFWSLFWNCKKSNNYAFLLISPFCKTTNKNGLKHVRSIQNFFAFTCKNILAKSGSFYSFFAWFWLFFVKTFGHFGSFFCIFFYPQSSNIFKQLHIDLVLKSPNPCVLFQYARYFAPQTEIFFQREKNYILSKTSILVPLLKIIE